MDGTSWNTGRQSPSSAFSSLDFASPEPDDAEFWKTVLTDRRLRSRFIRDLEMQSIGSRSLEDLARRYRDEEILPRSGAREL